MVLAKNGSFSIAIFFFDSIIVHLRVQNPMWHVHLRMYRLMLCYLIVVPPPSTLGPWGPFNCYFVSHPLARHYEPIN